MFTRMPRESVPYMHNVNPSQVLSDLSILPTEICSCESTVCAWLFWLYQAAPPTNARRKNDDPGRSKNTTAAPSTNASDASPKMNRQRTRIVFTNEAGAGLAV